MNNQFLQALKEVAKFLGDKLDGHSKLLQSGFERLGRDIKDSRQKVEMDITARAAEKLQESSMININKVVQTLTAIAQAEEKRITSLVNVIGNLEKAVRDETSDTQLLRLQLDQAKALKSAVDGVLSALQSGQNPKMAEQLERLIKVTEANKPEKVDINLNTVTEKLSDVVASLVSLQKEIARKDNKMVETKLDQLLSAFSKFKVDIPDTIKLEGQQLKMLTMGGAGVQLRGATKVTMANVALTATNTEYSYTFPANTVSWTIKLRAQNAKLYYAFTSGKMPAGGDSSAYATLGQNFLQSQDNVEWSGKIIYLGSDTASQTAEIVSYQM